MAITELDLPHWPSADKALLTHLQQFYRTVAQIEERHRLLHAVLVALRGPDEERLAKWKTFTTARIRGLLFDRCFPGDSVERLMEVELPLSQVDILDDHLMPTSVPRKMPEAVYCLSSRNHFFDHILLAAVALRMVVRLVEHPTHDVWDDPRNAGPLWYKFVPVMMEPQLNRWRCAWIRPEDRSQLSFHLHGHLDAGEAWDA